MARWERIIWIVCGLLILGSVGYIGMKAADNPMDTRYSDLEESMASVRYVREEFVTQQDVDYAMVKDQVLLRESLWKELIAPPESKRKAVAGPNLKKMLQGVAPSLRQEITGRDGRTLVNIKTPNDKNGSFMGEGDRVNKLTIIEITDESVVFGLTQGGKDYTEALPRR